MDQYIYPHLNSLKDRAHGSKDWAKLDFSINTNPLGPPQSIHSLLQQEDRNWLSKYPEIQATSLKKVLAKQLAVDPEQIMIGNGAAELFFLLPRVLKIHQGIVIQPTFGEYEPSLMAANIPIRRLYYQEQENQFVFPMAKVEQTMEAGDLLYLCRPNNPTGQMLSKAEVETLYLLAKEKKAFLLVDESFIAFTEEPEGLIDDFQKNKSLIIVRSLTKFYTIPGIRLGYMLAPSWLIHRMELARDPWSVNSLAQSIGKMMMEDQVFYHTTRTWIEQERSWFYRQLTSLPSFHVFPSKANFYLLKLLQGDARELYAFLKEKGIAIRLADSFYGLNNHYIRLAVKRREENQQLMEELKSFVSTR